MNTKSNYRETPYPIGEIRLFGTRPSGSSRKEVTQLIRTHSAEIVKEHERIFLPANSVLRSLHRLGHLLHVKKANAVGDVLGAKGMNLPFAIHEGKRHYLVPAVNWEPDQLESFFQLEPVDQVRRTRQLDKELLGIEHPVEDLVEEGGKAVHETLREIIPDDEEQR